MPAVERAVTLNWGRNRRANIVGTVAVWLTWTALQVFTEALVPMHGLGDDAVGSLFALHGTLLVASVCRHLNVTVGALASCCTGASC